jgi:hypothetical protein
MSHTPTDPALSTALAQAIGHPAPFSADECATLEELRLRGVRDLAFLSHLGGLRRLSVVASEIADLAPVRALAELRSLSLVATDVRDLAPLADCRTIEDLEVVFCSATDLTPVIAMPGLRRIRLMGNPWSDESWASRDQLWMAARARGSAPPLTEFSSATDRGRTLRFRNYGFPFSFHTIDDVVPVVVRPGVARLGKGDFDFVISGAAWLITDILETANATAESLMERWSQMAGDERVDLASGIVLGSSQDALGWIADSQLDQTDREHLSRFVRRFPQLTFYRDTAARLDRLEKTDEQKVTFPGWLRELRLVLAGVQPWSTVGLRFDAYDQSNPREDNVEQSWYDVGLIGYDLDTRRELLLDGAGVYPVGDWEDRASLGISITDPSDRQLYDFSELDLEEAGSGGYGLRDQLAPAFDSWASMLGHVIALRIDGVMEVKADG